MAAGLLLHYGDDLPLLSTAAARTPIPLTNRQSLERILFLLPVIYSSVIYGKRGGLTILALAIALMVPRAVLGPGDLVQALLQVAGISVTGGLFIWLVVSEHRRVEHANALTQRVMMAQEDERQRIARELHDETVQSLYILSQRLDRLARGDSAYVSEEVSTELLGVREIALKAGSDLRRVLQDLRPRILDDLGLLPALEWLADELLRQHGTRGRVEVHGALPELSPQAQLLLWRIAQEALHNVAKHARAGAVLVSLQGDGHRLRMTITDDGKGFDTARVRRELPRQAKLGIMGMQERARLLGGSLTVRSEPGRGTTISVDLPLAASLTPRGEFFPGASSPAS